MLVMRAQNLGAAGVVLNAHLRDGNAILSLNFSASLTVVTPHGLQRPPQCSGFSLFDHNRQGAGQAGRSDLWQMATVSVSFPTRRKGRS
jgi:hypothetical protein